MPNVSKQCKDQVAVITGSRLKLVITFRCLLRAATVVATTRFPLTLPCDFSEPDFKDWEAFKIMGWI
jgi:hypothetical protein